jgi:hypothetical protein
MAMLRRLFLSLPAAALARAGWANGKQPLKVAYCSTVRPVRR